ncbi:unnamed protein product, partial [Musa textilis]
YIYVYVYFYKYIKNFNFKITSGYAAVILLLQVFPRGWDKTYSLKYLGEFQEIHSFGDKTYKVVSKEFSSWMMLGHVKLGKLHSIEVYGLYRIAALRHTS